MTGGTGPAGSGHERHVFDHVTIRATDREASERFYETVLRTLGIEKTYSDDELAEWDDFSPSPASDEKPPTRVSTSASWRPLAL